MFGNISIWNLLIILVIIVLLFGTKRLRGIGGDLGSAIKGFRNSLKDDEKPESEKQEQLPEKKQPEAELSKKSEHENTKS